MPPGQPPEPRFCSDCGRPISPKARRCRRCAALHRADAQRRYPTAPASPPPSMPILWPALTECQLRVIRRAPPGTDWWALARHLGMRPALLLAVRAELLRESADDAPAGRATG